MQHLTEAPERTETEEDPVASLSNGATIHIKLFGAHDDAARQLRSDLDRALSLVNAPVVVREISEPNTISSFGITKLPALMIEDTLVFEGEQPGAENLLKAIQDHDLYGTKLYRLKRITVPVDMSPDASNAVRYAYAFAQSIGASMEVLHVLDQVFKEGVPGNTGFYAQYRQAVEQELVAFVGKHLNIQTATPGNPGPSESKPKISQVIDYGYPDQVIVSHSILSDLLIMSVSGSGALASNLFGSVSAHVLKEAQCPVLFVPAHTFFTGIKRILYASNFDSLQAKTIKQVAHLGKRFNSELFFAHVGPPDFEPAEFEAKLFEIDYQFAAPENPFHYQQIYGDNIPETLYNFALEQRIDLIVFVTHHRPFWEQLIHNSVTINALKNAQWPMLVLHTDADIL